MGRLAHRAHACQNWELAQELVATALGRRSFYYCQSGAHPNNCIELRS
jgi:hypothetical protein